MEGEFHEVRDRDLPDDACLIGRPPLWCVYYSPSEKQLYLEPSDDHAGPLAVSEGHLRWMLDVVENWSEELKELLLSGLEGRHDWLTQLELMLARRGSRTGVEGRVGIENGKMKMEFREKKSE